MPTSRSTRLFDCQGGTTQDLLANLFKAYKFVAYICKKEDQYQEGKDVDTDFFMLQAENKFKTMFEAKTWNAPSPKKEKILALEMQIQKRKSPSRLTRRTGKRKDPKR